MYRWLISISLLTVVFLSSNPVMARDQISIVGSSTVYPFATIVAEKFAYKTKFKTPKIESTGSGGGFKLFCEKLGFSTPDVTNSSRRIKQEEIDLCRSNGVTDIIEIKIGYDGIVLAHSRAVKPLAISLKSLYLALVKDIPDGEGGFVVNPYTSWSGIDSRLPQYKIEVLGPPPTSGTRDAFVELALEGGCKKFESNKALKAKDKKLFKARCHSIREDGAFVEAGENDNLIVQKLKVNPKAFGVFGFSFLEQNSNELQGAAIDGVAPTFAAIADGSYPISRPLYFYVKKDHIGKVPGLHEYIMLFTSTEVSGEDGDLSDSGLIPLPKGEFKAVREVAQSLQVLPERLSAAL